MSDWANDLMVAEAAATQTQQAEEAAEDRFDAFRARTQGDQDQDHTVKSEEFRAWMAARHATDAAWGAWSQVMDAKPQA
jgi:hypothetical protein